MRREGWEDLLAEALAREAAERRLFSWGSRDCFMWAADLLLAATGDDLAAPWRGKYRTELGAARCVRRFAGGDLDAGIAKRCAALGWPEIALAMARRLDLVVVDGIDIDGRAVLACGICAGATVIVAADGLTHLPLSAARRAWRV